jgi:hypothetical protein
MSENRAFRLRKRPEGRVTDADLEFVTEPTPDQSAGGGCPLIECPLWLRSVPVSH